MINTWSGSNDENLIPFTKYLGEYFRYITRNASDYMPLVMRSIMTKVITISNDPFPRNFESNRRMP